MVSLVKRRGRRRREHIIPTTPPLPFWEGRERKEDEGHKFIDANLKCNTNSRNIHISMVVNFYIFGHYICYPFFLAPLHIIINLLSSNSFQSIQKSIHKYDGFVDLKAAKDLCFRSDSA